MKTQLVALILCLLAQPGKAADQWTNQEDWNVTGEHIPVIGMFGEHCEDKDISVGANAKIAAVDTTVEKRDNDTHWDFSRLSDQHIHWHACANNCTFSCDTIILGLKWQTVPINGAVSASQASATVSEVTKSDDPPKQSPPPGPPPRPPKNGAGF
jgi:hypothetical protein